ncbi:serine/threonine-protein phosphatase 2A activator-like [Styela clava]
MSDDNKANSEPAEGSKSPKICEETKPEVAEEKVEVSTSESGGANQDTADENDPFKDHKFVVPFTQIKTVLDMAIWTKSSGYEDYLGFIMMLNAAIKGKKLSAPCEVSETTKKIVALLDLLDKWIDETPSIDQPQRFGNKAFRTWYEKLKEEGEKLTSDLLPDNLKRAASEIVEYLHGGFGNSTRIDYGTGHEMSFACFLCCFFKLQILGEKDKLAAVFHVFNRYLHVARKLQKTYRMEPAGSQGVWGLDDFQFLPFIWGSSQFFSHPTILPVHFVESKIVAENRSEYMFMECIDYIMSVKTGPFAEHSNTLWGISGVPHWGKVNSGLLKMYKAEILQKFPIIQHFKFGSILTLDPSPRQPGIKLN